MSLKYRSEIDGLRAIAVMAVVINHANESWLLSGYLGVDIFFVISGFLITQIISKEMLAGNFSFLEFYKRRVKRILPVFVFILLIITIIANILFIKEDFDNYLKSLIASLLFSANLFFSTGIGYFDLSSQEKPLLHIWSLSVEEQFYFIFPVILLVSIKIFKHKVYLLIILLILLSLLAYFLPSYSLEKYYLPHIRAYELLIGALFALIPPKIISVPLKWIIFTIMLIILVLPSSFFAVGQGYIERLIVCTSTALLLWTSYSQAEQSPKKFLSSPIFIFLGVISYSLYLWHWPILAFLRYVNMGSELSTIMSFSAIGLSILLAYLSYRFVEDPIRRIKNFSSKQFFSSLLLYLMLASLAFTYLLLDRKGIIPYQSHMNKELIWDTEICHDKLPVDNTSCLKGYIMSSKPKFLVVGDSHAAQYNQFIDYVGKKENWSADVISANSCSYLYQSERKEGISNMYNCNLFRRYIDQNIDQYDVIFLIGHWEFYINSSKYETEYLQEFEKTIKTLLGKGKMVYVFKDNPTVSYNILRNYHLSSLGLSKSSLPNSLGETQTANEQIYILTKKYPQVVWVDIAQYIPKNYMVDGYPMYKDTDHLNPFGSRALAEIYTKNNILKLK